MNPNEIKDEIKKHVNKSVIIKVYGMRNKITTYKGVIKGIYPNIFTILEDKNEKSFSYRDVITGEVKIKYCKET